MESGAYSRNTSSVASRHLPLKGKATGGAAFDSDLCGFRGFFRRGRRNDGIAVDPREVGDHDTSGRTALGAGVAVGAFGIIDPGEVVDDGDRAGGTVLFALFAPDTAVSTCFSGIGALVGVRAGHEHPLDVGHQVDQVVRAGSRADAAPGAFPGVP